MFKKIIASNPQFVRGVTVGWVLCSGCHYAIKYVDKNNDGITRDEIIDAYKNKMMEYDVNNDGVTSPGEVLDGVLNDVENIKKSESIF